MPVQYMLLEERDAARPTSIGPLLFFAFLKTICMLLFFQICPHLVNSSLILLLCYIYYFSPYSRQPIKFPA